MNTNEINFLNGIARVYDGKVVKVKADRKCFFGRRNIPKGHYCVGVTLFPGHDYNSTYKPKRIWICGSCAECTH